MTGKETMALLTMISANYPHAGIEASELTLMAWMDILGDKSLEDCRTALKIYVTRGEEFAPAPGQLYQIIMEAQNPAPDEAKIWRRVRRAIENAYQYEESRIVKGERVKKTQAQWAFESLPADLQNVVGDAWRLLAWNKMDDNELEAFARKDFFRDYKARKRMEAEAGLVAKISLPEGEKVKRLEAKHEG